MDWTKENVALLTDLWTAGHSASQIGQKLHCTRSAVIGKKSRLGLPDRLCDLQTSGLLRKKRGLPPIRLKKYVRKTNRKGILIVHRAPTIVKEYHVREDNDGILLPDTSPFLCMAILPFNEENGVRYCQDKLKPGSWCCHAHYALYYRPATQKIRMPSPYISPIRLA